MNNNNWKPLVDSLIYLLLLLPSLSEPSHTGSLADGYTYQAHASLYSQPGMFPHVFVGLAPRIS